MSPARTMCCSAYCAVFGPDANQQQLMPDRDDFLHDQAGNMLEALTRVIPTAHGRMFFGTTT